MHCFGKGGFGEESVIPASAEHILDEEGRVFERNCEE